MKNTISSAFIKSSNLLFITSGLILISFLIQQASIPFNPQFLTIAIINMLLIAGVSLVVRRGMQWTKYLPIILFTLYATEAIATFSHLGQEQIIQFLFAAQTIMVAWATIILFKKHKEIA